MKWLTTGARIVFGAIFLVFGLNAFFAFFPTPPPPGGAAESFMSGLDGAGYFFPLLSGIQVICGLLLLANRFVPLSVAALAPITVNILAYQAFLDQRGVPLAVVLVVLNIYLAWAYRDSFRRLFRADVEPTSRAGARRPPREGRRPADLREPAEA